MLAMLTCDPRRLKKFLRIIVGAVLIIVITVAFVFVSCGPPPMDGPYVQMTITDSESRKPISGVFLRIERDRMLPHTSIPESDDFFMSSEDGIINIPLSLLDTQKRHVYISVIARGYEFFGIDRFDQLPWEIRFATQRPDNPGDANRRMPDDWYRSVILHPATGCEGVEFRAGSIGRLIQDHPWLWKRTAKIRIQAAEIVKTEISDGIRNGSCSETAMLKDLLHGLDEVIKYLGGSPIPGVIR